MLIARRVAALIVLAATLCVLIPTTRTTILRTAGWSLVVADPLEPSDTVVVTLDAGDAGVLEAADLVRDGLASRVALLSERVTPAEEEFARRGVTYEDDATRAARQLKLLGVSAVERIPAAVDGSEAAARALREWAAHRRLGSVIVVSHTEHSRRVRRIMRRALSGQPVRLHVHPARYSDFHPDSWWATRRGVRTHIVESQKLLLDIIRHPLS